MNSKESIYEINAGLVRDYLVELIYHKRKPKEIFTDTSKEIKWELPKNGSCNYLSFEESFLYHYYKLLLEAEWIGLVHYCPYLYMPPDKKKDLTKEDLREDRKETILTLRNFIVQDLKKANILITLSAWLTVDDFRWHNLDSGIPKDLTYNFLLSHSDFLLPYAAYASGIKRQKLQREYFDSEILSDLDEKAKRNAENQAIK
jgi:hypothetical protein